MMGIEKKQVLINPEEENILLSMPRGEDLERYQYFLKPGDFFPFKEAVHFLQSKGLDIYLGGGVVNGIFKFIHKSEKYLCELRNYKDIDLLCTGETSDLCKIMIDFIKGGEKEERTVMGSLYFDITYYDKPRKRYFGSEFKERFKINVTNFTDVSNMDLTFLDKKTFNKNIR